jgi:hypothetical protein
MSLYPVTITDPATVSVGNNGIASGTLIAVSIDMTSTQMMQIVMAQLSLTQDYSLRTWVSVYPDGNAIAPGVFPILRNGIPFIIYVAGQTPPSNTYAILVTPGSYFLNILNLTNENNVFAFSPTELALAIFIVGCESTGSANIVQPTRVPSTFVGCGSTGEVGTVLTTISSTLVIVGAFSTGLAGIPRVMTVGLRLTSSQRLWQALRNKHQQR